MTSSEIPRMKLKDGASIPIVNIAYGTGSALMKATEDETIDRECAEQIALAIELGYRHLDCAQAYNNEREVGIAIQESKVSRELLFVTTKTLGFAPIAQALDASLEKLKLDYVDLYLLHIPWIESAKPLDEAWKEMEAVKASGKAKSIGVSNFLVSHLEKIIHSATVIPFINQFECSLYLQRTELYDFCQKHGIVMEAFATLTPCGVAAGGPTDELLGSLATKYSVTEAEICIRWCLERGMSVVTTSLRKERLSGYLRVSTFQLTSGEFEQLSLVGAKSNFRKYFTDHFDDNESS